MTSHTKGPWSWIPESDGEGRPAKYTDRGMPALVNSGGDLVCWFGNGETYYPTEGTRPSESDAHLIASAPDLLAACVEAESLLSGLEGISRNNAEQLAHEVGEVLRAAIAKAKGGAK